MGINLLILGVLDRGAALGSVSRCCPGCAPRALLAMGPALLGLFPLGNSHVVIPFKL